MSKPSKEAITWHKFVPGRDGTCISCGLKQKECQAKAAQPQRSETAEQISKRAAQARMHGRSITILAPASGAASSEPNHKTAICPFCHGSFVVNASHIMELQTASSEPQEWIIVHRKEGVLLCDIRQKDGSVICELISQFKAHPIVDAHKAAIDAEREKLKDESANGTTLFRQLIAAQAAIAKHNADLDAHCYPIFVDLSALEAHNAEVRKPLVEAGNAMRRTMYSNNSEESKAWDAALAQVKGGK